MQPTAGPPGPRAGMAIVPSLALRHGQAVELEPGPARRPAVQRPDPLEEARRYRDAGATWMDVVDLDAAFGERNQWPHLARLLDGRLRIQFGGGVRSMTQVQQLLDLGVERVVVGTQAVRNPAWARELARVFAGRVVLALDVQDGQDGWLLAQGRSEDAGRGAAGVAADLADAGLAGIVYAGAGGPPDLAVAAQVRQAAPRLPLWVRVDAATAAGAAGGLEGGLDALEKAGAAAAVLGLGACTRIDLAAALRRHPPPPARPLVRVLRGREEADGEADGTGDGG